MPTPSGLVTKQELIDAQLDTAHLGRVVNSKDALGNPITTSTNRTGGTNRTLDALEADYLEAIQGAGGIPIGTWTAGVTTFNAFNEYAIYNGIPYKPRTSATLPYVAQGANPTTGPDDANVQPYQEITEAQVVAVVEETIPDLTNIVYKASGGNSAVENMIAGVPIAISVGDTASTGAGSWKRIASNGGVSDFIPLNGVWISDFGDTLDGVNDSTQQVKDAFEYASNNGLRTVKGEGVALISSQIDITSHFNCGGAFTFLRASAFADEITVRTGATNLKIKGIRVSSQSPTKVGRGFAVHHYNTKLTNIVTEGFDIGLNIRSFSCKALNCRSTVNNTNLSMSQLDGGNEINAVVIDGGEYFGAVDYAMVIGDQRDYNPVETHGVNIKVINTPTLDQGCILIDKVIQVEISAYFEGLTSTKQNAYVQIDNTDNTCQNIDVHHCNVLGAGSQGQYFVKAVRACRGLSVHDNQASSVPKCILKTDSDIYPVRYENNQITNSSVGYPVVGIGVRSGQNDNALSRHTIDVLGISQGVPDYKSIYTYNNATISLNDSDRGRNDTYIGGIGLFKTSNRNNIGVSVVDSSTVLCDVISESGLFNGGECVVVGSTTTYIINVDYDTGIIKLNTFGLTSESTLSHKEPEILTEYWTYSKPTTTNFAFGSVARNTYANTPTPDGWVYKTSGWEDMS